MAAGLERPRPVQDEQRRPASEILRARDVSLSVGAHPYGPRAQLHHGRRGGALQARQGLQRAPSDGLGRLRHAGGKRRDAEQGPPEGMDLCQHRDHALPAAIDGACHRLEPRDRDLRSELLQAPAAHVPGLPGSRPRRPQDGEGELGPGRSHRARQRAGDRRARLALGRARRAARADPVVPEDHRFRAGSRRQARHPRPLAGEGAPDAAQLDRPLGGPAGPLCA